MHRRADARAFPRPFDIGQGDISSDFQAFLIRVGTGAPQSQTEREDLFRQFMHWREQQGGRRR